MTLEEVRRKDPADMYSAIHAFPEQARTGIELGKGPRPVAGLVESIVILGMGGSAIGGDLLRSYVQGIGGHNVRVAISRGYDPPPVGRETLLVASSYSGNTEETLEAYEKVYDHAGEVLIVTTGGKLAGFSSRAGHQRIAPPAGLQPRAALAYSFFPLLQALAVESALFGPEVKAKTEAGIEETLPLLEALAGQYGSGPGSDNPAWALAEKLQGKIPVLYSAADRFDTVNLRWRGQIQENAKQLAFGNLLPEMNHNEINGWVNPPERLKDFIAVFLTDTGNHPQVSRRLEITEKLLRERGVASENVASQGESLLARMFSLIHLGDWVSYYLALMNGEDPMPVPVIEDLKVALRGS